jgi:hypothetical protein
MTHPGATPALARAIERLAAQVEVPRIDRVWLFAPRALAGREHGLLVLSVLPAGGSPPDQRAILTLTYEAAESRGELTVTDVVTEQGSVPADRVPRVIAGLLRRLRDEPADPLEEEIGGDPERWAAFLRRLGGDG